MRFFKPKKSNLNSPKNAYFKKKFAYFRKDDEFLPDSSSNLFAERIYLLEKQPVKFIPLWKIVKIAFYDFKLPAWLKIGLAKWYVIFFHRRALKIASYKFCTCNGI